MRIAVDAMGGDNAPEAIVAGALEAAELLPDAQIILVGISEEIKRLNPGTKVEILSAPEVILNEDKPLMAIRRKRNSSLVRCLTMLKDKEVDAIVSAGNTGAFMAGASLIVGRIPGITKPALAPVLPTELARGVIALDLGATMDAKPENLYQFGIMGSLYAKTVFDINAPRIGLLNVGVEPEKGNDIVRKVFSMLAADDSLNFVGNIEARDVMKGECDVLICDGFVGNVLLKSMEGTAQSIFTGIKSSIVDGGIKAKLGALLLKDTLRKFKRQLDYSEHGGAPLLGINGVCIKCHGSSNATTVKNAILKQAYRLVKESAVDKITAMSGGEKNE
ncbi:MAG: phosphate acyltransferase PlsX [Firmicutes bacterium]|nr:phosphate acyltransferase PlsX [Bacillota bacterium]